MRYPLGTKLFNLFIGLCTVCMLLASSTASAMPMMMDFFGTASDSESVQLSLFYDPDVKPFRLSDNTEQISNTGMILQLGGMEFSSPFVTFIQRNGDGIDIQDAITYTATLVGPSDYSAAITYSVVAQPNFNLVTPDFAFTNTAVLLSNNVISFTVLSVALEMTQLFTSTVTFFEISNNLVDDVSEPLSLGLFAIALTFLGLFAGRRSRA